MYRQLADRGRAACPNGFAITADGLPARPRARPTPGPQLHAALDGLDATTSPTSRARAALAREIVYGAAPAGRPRREILAAYARLRAGVRRAADASPCAARATAEDLPTASFAGQHETFLNVARRGTSCWTPCAAASPACSPTAPSHYRHRPGLRPLQGRAVGGRDEDGALRPRVVGVIFTLDTESGFRDVVFITGAYGLGENVVQGAVDPDEFYVHKPTFEAGHRAVLRRRLGGKEIRMVYAEGGPARPPATCRPRTTTGRASASPTRRCWSSPARRRSRTIERHDRPRRWTSSGPRTASTASSTSSRRGPRPWPRRRRGHRRSTLRRRGPRRRAGRAAARSASRIASGRARGHPRASSSSASSGPARCWSPTRPRPTGSR